MAWFRTSHAAYFTILEMLKFTITNNLLYCRYIYSIVLLYQCVVVQKNWMGVNEIPSQVQIQNAERTWCVISGWCNTAVRNQENSGGDIELCKSMRVPKGLNCLTLSLWKVKSQQNIFTSIEMLASNLRHAGVVESGGTFFKVSCCSFTFAR